MIPFDISRLRCLVYHNGLSNYRLALTYGLKIYGMPESRKNPKLFLNLLELIADEYHRVVIVRKVSAIAAKVWKWHSRVETELRKQTFISLSV